MKRTQIYISEHQDRLLAGRAKDAGVSKAAIIRRLLDDGLGIDDGGNERRRAIEATAGVLADAPDWEEWLGGVRGGEGSAARLEEIGT